VRDDEGDGYTWTAPTRCVWKAPDFLDYCYVLAADVDFRSNKKIRRLFTDVLEIGNVDWSHYLAQLRQDKDCDLEDYDLSRPSNIYREVGRDVTESSEWEKIRYVAPLTRYDYTI